MKRADAINAMRFAGYHGDKATFTSLLIENRVSQAVATAAFREGTKAKADGVRCNCINCRAA